MTDTFIRIDGKTRTITEHIRTGRLDPGLTWLIAVDATTLADWLIAASPGDPLGGTLAALHIWICDNIGNVRLCDVEKIPGDTWTLARDKVFELQRKGKR